MGALILDVIVYTVVSLAVFAGLNTIFVAQGGVRIVDRYFGWDLSEWEKHYPPTCCVRFNIKYCHRYVIGKERPQMPLIMGVWLYISYLGNIALLGLALFGGYLEFFG